jgi:hypothetical protein
MLVFYILWETWLPEDAVEQGRDVRKEFLFKVAAVFGRVLVVVCLVKFSIRVPRNNAVFSVNIYDIDCLPMDRIVFCGYDLIELRLFDNSDWQVFQNLQASLSGPSPSGHSEDHR